MAFKTLDQILKPDERFHDLCVVEAGVVRRMTLQDHHASIEAVGIGAVGPDEVREAFDRARNTLLYAYFDYELLVVAEVQAFGAFELALKHRLNGHGGEAKGTLRNLVDRARKQKIFPPLPPTSDTSRAWSVLSDPIEAMVMMRNGLAHGTAQIHSPGMALQVLESCAWAIDTVFPRPMTE